MKYRILAFGHQKSVGKDQFVKFLIDIIRPIVGRKTIVRRGFADKLYDACHMMYGWAGFRDRAYYAAFPDEREKVLIAVAKTPRQILIEVGNHMRKYDELVWLNATVRGEDFDLLLITDLRYPNEFHAVKAMGGMCTKVTRPGLVRPTDEADTALDGWDKWDLIVSNDADLAHLYSLAEVFVKEHVL